MKKVLCICVIIICLVLFGIYNFKSNHSIKVVKIFSPVSYLLDNNEHININAKVLSFSNKDTCIDFSNKSKIEIDDVMALGYLADKFAEDNLLGKSVDTVDYEQRLMKSGFVISDSKPVNPEKFEQLLKYVRKQNFKIYNIKSRKYHRLSCKYGVLAKDSVIIPKCQIPKEAFPCKYCLNIQVNKKPKSAYLPLPRPELVFSTKYIKIFLSDHTTNLKPSRECKSFICKELVNQINSAQSTIDMAIYGYDRVPAIEFALSNAIKRGVKIRLIYDTDLKGGNIYPDTDYLAKMIPDSKCDSGADAAKLMHDKFYIFDSKTVITGSANLSYTDMSGFNSNSVIMINSPSAAKIYEQEFNQMFDSKFHGLKDVIPCKNDIILGDSVLSIYFSPKDNTINHALIPLINSAKKYIYIPAFLITDKGLTNALISAKERGVDIKVIVDAVNAKGKASKHQILRDNGIPVKTENYAGKLHSKSMIIDDKYVIIGSMNFSYSGNTRNDENSIVLKNSNAAIFYRKYFEYLWSRIYKFWLTHDVSPESKYSIGSLSDGIDNDYDGLIDEK